MNLSITTEMIWGLALAGLVIGALSSFLLVRRMDGRHAAHIERLLEQFSGQFRQTEQRLEAAVSSASLKEIFSRSEDRPTGDDERQGKPQRRRKPRRRKRRGK